MQRVPRAVWSSCPGGRAKPARTIVWLCVLSSGKPTRSGRSLKVKAVLLVPPGVFHSKIWICSMMCCFYLCLKNSITRPRPCKMPRLRVGPELRSHPIFPRQQLPESHPLRRMRGRLQPRNRHRRLPIHLQPFPRSHHLRRLPLADQLCLVFTRAGLLRHRRG
jgi:hypothetical protein